MLKTRIITAAALLSIFAIMLALGPLAISAACVAISGRVIFEFLTTALLPSRRSDNWIKDDAVLYSALLTIPTALLIFPGLEAAAVATVAVVLAILIREAYIYESAQDEEPTKEVLSALGIAVAYPYFLGAALVGAALQVGAVYPTESWKVILWFVALVVFSDTGAFFGGKMFGKHKLAPRISPNKTIEGLVSGVILVVAAGIPLALYLQIRSPLWSIIAVTLLISLLAPVGDLVESLLKRIYGVKDMAQLLPGHGGLFDRVDSYLFAAPALFFLVAS